MKLTTRNRLTAAVTLAIAALIGYQAFGTMRAGQPTVIVTVNLAQVMEKLDQRADQAARLNKIRDDFNAEQERRSNDVKKMTDQMKTMQTEVERTTEPAARQDLERRMSLVQDQAARATLEFQAWYAFSTEKMDVEAALAMQDLYRSVKTNAASMAAANRYDIVLVDDSQGDLTFSADSRVPRTDQVRQQIAGRRMLHVNPTIDITDDLIQRMNNAHKTAGPRRP